MNYKHQSPFIASSQVGIGEAVLGNATELRTPPSFEVVDSDTGEVVALGQLPEKEAISQSRSIRFRLQNQARKILYGFHGEKTPVNAKGYEVHHRTCTCTRFLTGSKVSVLKSQSSKRHFYGGLMSCANARTCPVCAAKINEHKASEMRTAANLAQDKGVIFSLLTFTAPHTASDSLEDLIKSVSLSLSGFFRGKPYERFKKKYGIIGYVRSFEVRYGSNGWHPHFHLLMVSKRPLPFTKRSESFKPLPFESQDSEWQWVLNRWQNMCFKHGLNMPNEYGLDIQNGGKAGAYITKFGSDGEILQTQSGKSLTWDIADEVSKGHFKIGRKGSFSPWDLLSESIDAKSKKQQGFFRTLFLDYARCMKGVTLLKWSRGLRDFFGLNDEKTDEQIIKDDLDKALNSAAFSSKLWRLVLDKQQQSLLLDIIDNGGFDGLARYLYDLDDCIFDFETFKSSLLDDVQCEFVPQLTESNNKNYFNPFDISDGKFIFGLDFAPRFEDLDLDLDIKRNFNDDFSHLPNIRRVL